MVHERQREREYREQVYPDGRACAVAERTERKMRAALQEALERGLP